MYFHGGTLVIEGEKSQGYPSPWRWSHGKWRCKASHYASVLAFVRSQQIHDAVPRWQPLNYELADRRDPHDYQEAALSAWRTASRRGSVILPTGAGKSFVAVRAIQEDQPLYGDSLSHPRSAASVVSAASSRLPDGDRCLVWS